MKEWILLIHFRDETVVPEKLKAHEYVFGDGMLHIQHDGDMIHFPIDLIKEVSATEFREKDYE